MTLLDNVLPSVEARKAFASAELHSTLLLHFLMGIYTGVYAATIHIYRSTFEAGSSRTRIILGALTALYATILADTCMNWYFLNSDGTPVVHVVFDIIPKFEFLLADGLMVWRCFHASGRSDRLFILPMGLYFIEFALSTVYIVLTCLISLAPGFSTDQRTKQLGDIQGTLYATVAATSLTSTLIICRSIYVNTTESAERLRRKYRHVVDILIQSAAVHSTSMLLAAIFQYLDTAKSSSPSQSVDVPIYYFVPLSVPVLGLAPTLMVCRLAVASYNKNTDGSLVYVSSGYGGHIASFEVKSGPKAAPGLLVDSFDEESL